MPPLSHTGYLTPSGKSDTGVETKTFISGFDSKIQNLSFTNLNQSEDSNLIHFEIIYSNSIRKKKSSQLPRCQNIKTLAILTLFYIDNAIYTLPKSKLMTNTHLTLNKSQWAIWKLSELIFCTSREINQYSMYQLWFCPHGIWPWCYRSF